MMKKIFNFIFLGLVCILLVGLINIVNSQTSSTRTDFTIAGCEGGLFLDECSRDGDFYCNLDGQLLDTILEEGACSEIGGIGCCPEGYICEDKCKVRLYPCSYFTEFGQDECEDQACWWIDGECVDPHSPSLTCAIYHSKLACENDTYRVARRYDICGKTVDGKIIPTDSCRCVWNETDCTFRYNLTDMIHNGTAEWFECERFDIIGDCIEGSQWISWTASIISSSPGYIPSSDESAACEGGSMSIACGEAIIQLPFFSALNIILVILVIIIFYIIYENMKKTTKSKIKHKQKPGKKKG